MCKRLCFDRSRRFSATTLAMLVFFGFSSIAAAVTYTVTDIGTLGGSSGSGININSAGEAVGVSSTAASQTHAFLYDGTSMRDLGTLSPSVPFYSGAYGINDSGDVVGTSMNASYQNQAFFYDRSLGTMTAIPTLGGATNDAFGINASGLVAGYSNVATDGELHAYVYNTSTAQMTSLGQLQDCVSSLAYAINDGGLVVGNCIDSSYAAHGFLYDLNLGSMTGIGALVTGGQSTARGINNAGFVVGSSRDVDGHDIAIMYDSNTGAMSPLGTLGGSTSEALDINANGQIVGHSYNSTGTDVAMFYGGGEMFDLNVLAVDLPAGWTLTQANGINDLGQIVCTGKNGGVTHAFILTPVPEPGALALFAMGIISILAFAWHKRRYSI